ncbi:hypothetical protein [Streptomyces antimicrobicus]|uniref:Uncharacterized protein n=1 Tax=Streptomyces antimicrobicus TaxID=2883108 RepID=A0ABS8B863_9ACTN|nr:hypothetical protein [Streptomyces antimicrobicus]MCB5180808.1 hypothetical protein [Streptomyces antimicrobicus]
MSVDPDEPETFLDEVPDALDAEAPEADAAEQHTELSPRGDDPLTGRESAEAADADAAEQARVVTLDEEEYR